MSALFLTIGSILVVAGVGVTGASAVLRDDDGMYRSGMMTWSTPGYAVRTEAVHLHPMPMMPGGPGRMIGTVRVTANAGPGHDVFVGLAREADLDRYLGQVAGSTVEDPWDADSMHARFSRGAAPALAPSAAGFWRRSASGPGTQTLSWTPRAGRWCVVVMNPDGSAPVAADVRFGAELPVVNASGAVLVVTGLLVLVASGVGLWFATPRSRQPLTDRP